MPPSKAQGSLGAHPPPFPPSLPPSLLEEEAWREWAPCLHSALPSSGSPGPGLGATRLQAAGVSLHRGQASRQLSEGLTGWGLGAALGPGPWGLDLAWSTAGSNL